MTVDATFTLHWDSDPDRWDACLLDGRELPGLATVKVRHEQVTDRRKPRGRNGARLVDTGAKPAKVTIELRVLTEAQLEELYRVMPSLHYRHERHAATAAAVAETAQARKTRVPAPQRRPRDGARRERAHVAISHPQTDLFGITAVYVETIESGDPEQGVMTLRFDCTEYRPPRASDPSVTRRPGAPTLGTVPLALQAEQRAPSLRDNGPTLGAILGAAGGG
jgi:hypothetical protein